MTDKVEEPPDSRQSITFLEPLEKRLAKQAYNAAQALGIKSRGGTLNGEAIEIRRLAYFLLTELCPLDIELAQRNTTAIVRTKRTLETYTKNAICGPEEFVKATYELAGELMRLEQLSRGRAMQLKRTIGPLYNTEKFILPYVTYSLPSKGKASHVM